MSSDDEYSNSEKQPNTMETLYQNDDEFSIDVPREEWSSLVIEDKSNIKMIQYAEGLYDPGSGEVCAKYISMSDSDVMRHVYFKYPAIINPGIEQALLGPIPKVEYPDDGQKKYLAICDELSIPIIKSFYISLLTTKVDLSFYGLNKKGIWTICLALRSNEFVKVLDLTDNWLDTDDCFHLGEMLTVNKCITDLILNGCRIKPLGAEALFHHLQRNRSLRVLELSRNQLSDKGVEYLANAMIEGMSVTNFNLSQNNLTDKAVLNLAEVFQIFTNVSHLNLSSNVILTPVAIAKLCNSLAEHDNLQVLDLSWSSLKGVRVGETIKILLKNSKSLQSLILNNNRIDGEAVKDIGLGLSRAKKLNTLNLSYNPLSCKDALMLLEHMKQRKVKLQFLLLDNVVVDDEFVETRKGILLLPFRQNAVITHGHVRPKMTYQLYDMRLLLLRRGDAIGRTGKKKDHVDFPLFILGLYRDDTAPKGSKEFLRLAKQVGLKLNEDFVDQMAIVFPGPRAKDNSRTINFEAVVDYIKRLWPDKKLPPPPPELIVPPPTPNKKPAKGKK